MDELMNFFRGLGILMTPAPETLEGLAALAFFAAISLAIMFLYFLPAIVAKGHEKSGAIFILNLLLGWTFIGWVAALVWAAASPRRIA